MKPNDHYYTIPLAFVGICFVFLSPASRAKEKDKDEKALEVEQAQDEAEEKGKVRLEEEIAKRTQKAAEGAKEAKYNAGRAKEVAEANETKKPEVKGDGNEAEGEDEKTPNKKQGRKESDPAAQDRHEQRRTENAQERRERPIRPVRPAEPAVPTIPATPTTPPVLPPPPASPPRGDEKTPPIDMPVVPTSPLKPREKPPGNDDAPNPEVIFPPGPATPAPREIIEIAPTEPERQAETRVTDVTRELNRDLDQRKTRIEGREQAQALVDDILGAESRISRAEIAREESFRQRFERQSLSEERFIEVTPDQRREATTYYQQRLRGREVEGSPPEFFQRFEHRADRRDVRIEERVEQVEFVRPRYLNEGRRYVHYDSRASIPAILMAAQAMNLVRFQPTREIAPIFYERREDAIPLPPENYRGQDSVVVSYPVDEKSMISSEAILFLQGSTQFSDPYSYDVVAIMADAMKAMPEEERFVIEGHASAEGSYESNMILSQQRAELIVREIVRRGGISPYRLLPVGYGESEARHPEDAAEHLRSKDRRVVVFRMKDEPVAKFER